MATAIPSNVRVQPNGAVKCTLGLSAIDVYAEPRGDWYSTTACGGGWIHRSQIRPSLIRSDRRLEILNVALLLGLVLATDVVGECNTVSLEQNTKVNHFLTQQSEKCECEYAGFPLTKM
jgi:hypothetical protein